VFSKIHFEKPLTVLKGALFPDFSVGTGKPRTYLAAISGSMQKPIEGRSVLAFFCSISMLVFVNW
jgi:hypothetical protein